MTFLANHMPVTLLSHQLVIGGKLLAHETDKRRPIPP
jgi:hypothetical protein